MDIGATYHLTHDTKQLHTSTLYSSHASVMLGNRSTIPIGKCGSTTMSCNNQTMNLNDLLLVTQLEK